MFQIPLLSFLWRDWKAKNRNLELTYRDEESHLNRDENDAEEGSHASNKVEFVDLPDENGGVHIKQAHDGNDNDGGEDGVGRVLKQRRDELQREEHDQRHHDVGHCGVAPCHVVHRRTREGACENRRLFLANIITYMFINLFKK